MQYTLKKAFNFIKWRDIGHLFLAAFILPWALLAKIFVRGFWLVCEEKNEARDNGYWFYRWVRENRPKQRIAYAIGKKSPDYAKVKDLGKTVRYGSLSHWFWYIVADRNISSQKGGKPNAAVCYLFEVVLKFRKKNRVFLQHGVIKDVLEWLYYPNTNMRLFVTSAAAEQEFIANTFGYPQGYIQMLGLSRFDALHDAERDENLILVMPTWRNWLGREGKDNRDLDFCETEYFKTWSGFLHSPALAELLETYNKQLIFYPHRHMQKFVKNFSSSSPRVTVADFEHYDVQDLLKRAALLITDYSSVFFDFAYMRKPVLFYQFDEKEFREKQYAEGYFNYHNTVLGKWADTEEGLCALLGEQLAAGMPLLAEETVRSFFPLWDTENRARTYEAICALKRRKK